MTFAWKTLCATSTASMSLALTAISPPAPWLMWNTTASAPVGLYRLAPTERAAFGDLVVARPPEPLASWFDEAGYLPRGVPLVKHVAAVTGQRICRAGEVLTVDGRRVARARERDRLGRRLPVWSGCYRLGRDDLLLLNSAPDSLDGRYFGPSHRADLIGRAIPIWTRGGR
ncbi:S26 family signal peptidase [Phenylobacterium sp.]|uniref:S26 family signal peptidase n=1 Tax=Phenylobacterium sp. TaxID=1871053 RepID=UPI002FC78477